MNLLNLLLALLLSLPVGNGEADRLAERRSGDMLLQEQCLGTAQEHFCTGSGGGTVSLQHSRTGRRIPSQSKSLFRNIRSGKYTFRQQPAAVAGSSGGTGVRSVSGSRILFSLCRLQV